MQIIKKLSSFIEEEIADARKYAKCALAHKDDDPALAQVFNALSLDEMKHMGMLHDAVTRLISQMEDEDDDPRTEGMKIAYEFLHEKAIEEAAEVKVMQNMFRE